MTDTQETVRADFIEMVGLFAQDEGLPRISGRIMGLLMFDGGALSFGDLATQLQVSRGSISANARLLSDRGIIRKKSVPGDRQDYYQIEPEPYRNLLADVARRAERNAARIRATLKLIEGDDCGERLHAYADFYDALSQGIDRAARIVAKGQA